MTVATLAQGSVGTAARKFLGLFGVAPVAMSAMAGSEHVCSQPQSYRLSGTTHEQEESMEPEVFGGALTF